MRELILKQIEEQIVDGDEEIVDNYGSFEKIKNLPDEELLDVYGFMVGFRG